LKRNNYDGAFQTFACIVILCRCLVPRHYRQGMCVEQQYKCSTIAIIPNTALPFVMPRHEASAFAVIYMRKIGMHPNYDNM